MTIPAIRFQGCGDKLPLVEIIMTIRTSVVFQWIGHFCFVALFTIHRDVFPFQWIPGQFVVKILFVSDLLERFLYMALPAICAEFLFMDIIMAGHTRVKVLVLIILEYIFRSGVCLQLMALYAIYCLVLAHQWKPGGAVIKSTPAGKFLERIFRVAFLTVRTECSIVNILVTDHTTIKGYPGKFLK